MSDLYVSINNQFTHISIDSFFAEGDATLTDDLRPAVIFSLMTDARAHDDDEVPGNPADRRGYWHDTFLPDEGDSEGSRLYLLQGKAASEETRLLAEGIVKQALQHMIDDGLVLRFSIDAWWEQAHFLGIHVIGFGTDDQLLFDERYGISTT